MNGKKLFRMPASERGQAARHGRVVAFRAWPLRSRDAAALDCDDDEEEEVDCGR
jgi:hypothetical protein